MPTDPISELRGAVGAAIAAVGGDLGAEEPSLERPPDADLGHYSTNAAMRLASQLRDAPRSIAERLGAELESGLGTVERVEVAGPGFLNLFFADAWHREAVVRILAAERFGAREPSSPNVLLEFVSANPTGPLTAAGGRGAAYGDSLARVLDAAGHEVAREYYLNDGGTQIRNFAASIAARMRGEEPPEDGYSGEYVSELADELAAAGASADDLDDLARRGAEAMRLRIEATLERFGVHYDIWSSERELLERGALEAALAALARRRPHVPDRGRPMAADHRLRRRQGPGPGPL